MLCCSCLKQITISLPAFEHTWLGTKEGPDSREVLSLTIIY